jgi:transposase
MPPVDRKNPVRSKSSDSQYSLMEFMREFPDDDACLNWLWRERYSADGKHADCPKCGREQVPFKHYRTKQRRQTWTCTKCGHHVQPTAGTIFEGSSTSLHLWFYAIHLMTSTRCGISAKQLERELGVTYKTAWRMFNRIRNELMSDDDDPPLSGDVEIDETSVEGRPRVHLDRSAAARLRERSRATVLGMVERGGRVRRDLQNGMAHVQQNP